MKSEGILGQEGTAPKCKCGFGIEHHMVSKEGVYTLVGKFWVMFGVTTEPIAIKYRCRKCNEIFHQTNDKNILKNDV